MNYEVYCDESCVEALFDKESHRYAVIGGVWIPSESRSELKNALNKIKVKYKLTLSKIQKRTLINWFSVRDLCRFLTVVKTMRRY